MDKWIEKNPDNYGAPREGSFPEVGIDHFSRHGFGIRILCDKEIVEFDFIPKHLEKKDYLDIEEIDIYWSFVHYKSLYPNSKLTEEKWNESVNELNQKGIVKKLSWNRCAFPGYKLKESR